MKRYCQLLVFMVLAMMVTGCSRGPLKIERFVEIGPSETVFVIPLEGSTDKQARTDSVKFLEQAKVNAKRISIPQREHRVGHMAHAYVWMPTVRVIKANRAPVTREWTSDETSGTATKNEGLEVQSNDGVMFALGGTITCRIEEDETALYLHHYGTVPSTVEGEKGLVDIGRPLSEVVDANIRSYMQARLFHHFSQAPLEEGKQKKIDYFQSAFKDATAYFKARGITIDSFGSTKGLTYINPKVQDAINKKFLAENQKLVALQDKAEAEKHNQKKVDMAVASRKSAEQFLEAREAMVMSYDLEIRTMQAQARKSMAERWDGQMPKSILPSGGQQLMLNLSDAK